VIDILGVTLASFNVLLIINIKETINYQYVPTVPYRYLKYISPLIRKSLLDLAKLFYVSFFFRLFPWRLNHSRQAYISESNNMLSLYVLLTLLFMATLVDLLFFALFGIYCAYLHPRKHLYRKRIAETHDKFKYTAIFVLHTAS
jgi:hypothetical protein